MVKCIPLTIVWMHTTPHILNAHLSNFFEFECTPLLKSWHAHPSWLANALPSIALGGLNECTPLWVCQFSQCTLLWLGATPLMTLEYVSLCSSVQTVDWDHFLGPLEWGRADTVEMTDGCTRGNFPGVVSVNKVSTVSLGYPLSVFNKKITLKGAHFDAKFAANIHKNRRKLIMHHGAV